MKGLLGLIISVTVFSAPAQSGYKLVNGKVYSVIDPGAWTVLTDSLRIIGFAGNDYICLSYKTKTYDAGGRVLRTANPRYIPNRVATTIPGQRLILRNYRGQVSVPVGSDISPPIKAIRTGHMSISQGGDLWTTNSSRSGRSISVSVYDMGVDYFPPPRVLTPAEQEAAAQRHAEQEKKTIQWLFNQATNGSASAESSLGFRYLHGQGVPKDEATGIQWLQRASAHGDTEATAKLAQLAAARTNAAVSTTSAANSEAPSAKLPGIITGRNP
jgi:hypothetical protein